jgi:hypothetical protein
MPTVAMTPTCAECERRWLPDDDERWRAYHGGDGLDEPAELVFYCPDSADREFGSAPT